MRVQILETGEILTGRGYADIVRRLDPQLVEQQGLDAYMQGFRKRYLRMYGVTLFFKDAKTFIQALNNDNKFLKVVNN